MGASSSPLHRTPNPGRMDSKPQASWSPSQAVSTAPLLLSTPESGAWCEVPQNSLRLHCRSSAACTPCAQLSKAAVTPQHRHGRQQLRRGNGAGGTMSWHSPTGCWVTTFSLHKALVAESVWDLPATRGCSLSALTARKVARSRSSMATPPRGVGVFWRHCGQGIQRCSLATASRRLRQAWQKVWPQ